MWHKKKEQDGASSIQIPSGKKRKEIPHLIYLIVKEEIWYLRKGWGACGKNDSGRRGEGER